MKVINLLALFAFLAVLSIINAQQATNTTDFVAPPPGQFFPGDPAVVKGPACRVQKVGGTTTNNCCYQGFTTINKKCQIDTLAQPCADSTPKCNRDEACLATYLPKNTPCIHRGRTARPAKIGRKNGRRNKKINQGLRLKKKQNKKKKDNEINVSGFCIGLDVAELASQKDPVNFPANKVLRSCKTVKQIQEDAQPFVRKNKQVRKGRKAFRKGKSDPTRN
jgi:hypothetical protein